MLNSQFKFKKEEFKKNVQDNVKTLCRRTIDEATPEQVFQAVSYAVKDVIIDNWLKSQEAFDEQDPLYEAGYPRVTHPSAAQSQKSSSEESNLSASLDLHVLSTPPAFILSQDQTLV